MADMRIPQDGFIYRNVGEGEPQGDEMVPWGY